MLQFFISVFNIFSIHFGFIKLLFKRIKTFRLVICRVLYHLNIWLTRLFNRIYYCGFFMNLICQIIMIIEFILVFLFSFNIILIHYILYCIYFFLYFSLLLLLNLIIFINWDIVSLRTQSRSTSFDPFCILFFLVWLSQWY